MTSQREVNDGRGGPSSRGRGGTAIRPDPVFFSISLCRNEHVALHSFQSMFLAQSDLEGNERAHTHSDLMSQCRFITVSPLQPWQRKQAAPATESILVWSTKVCKIMLILVTVPCSPKLTSTDNIFPDWGVH